MPMTGFVQSSKNETKDFLRTFKDNIYNFKGYYHKLTSTTVINKKTRLVQVAKHYSYKSCEVIGTDRGHIVIFFVSDHPRIISYLFL